MARHRSMSVSSLAKMLTSRYAEDTRMVNLSPGDHKFLAASPGATAQLRGAARAALSNSKTRCAWVDIRR